MVVQCKDYENNVGNDSVQQIFSAKTHFNASLAVVVSRAKFTPSAQSLSSSTGVLLLSPDELSTI